MTKVRYHQLAAVSILLAGVVVLLGWGRSMGVEAGAIKEDRDRFQGTWVATLVQAGGTRQLEGAEASECRAEFVGKNVVFHNIIDEAETRGTAYLEKHDGAGWIDIKLDAGWSIGVYEFDGEKLKIVLNTLAPPERLGVPTRPRPRQVKAGAGHLYYEFRRVGKS
jgi:uncharacterized protein (TIGR03067 family)